MRTILLVLLALIPALPAVAQAPGGILIDQGTPPQEDRAAAEAKRREDAVERCKAERGTDCETDAGLAEWRDRAQREAEGPRSVDPAAPTPTPTPRPAN